MPQPTPGAGGKSNAPPFPYTEADARSIEQDWVTAFMGESQAAVIAASTKELKDLMNVISDQVFFEMYQIQGLIPAKSKRGTGWQKYVDSWLRIYDDVKARSTILRS